MRALLGALSFCVLTACNGGSSAPEQQLPPPVAADPNFTIVRSALPRNMAPAASDNQLEQFVQHNNQFGWQLYHQQAAQSDNVFFSPYSISTTLAMLYAGAAGHTATEIATAMQFSLAPAQLHQAFNLQALRLQQELAGHQAPFELHSLNGAFVERTRSFLPAYLDLLAQQYDAGLYGTDFKQQPELSRSQINQWIAKNTAGRISELLPVGSVTADTALALVNTLYFKARWYQVFAESQTTQAPFYLMDGSSQPVPLMYQTGMRLPFVITESYAALSLPYENPAIEMLVVVPETGNFAAVEAALDASSIQSMRSAMQERLVDLHLPRFNLSAQLPLGSALQQLGMREAFMPGTADFSAMDGSQQLFLSSVQHQAVISVDETGTEAAAATGAVVGVISSPQYAALRIDRPFIFIIQQRSTGAMLFMGRVLQP
ncbi:serpin family protein [Arsukibacterium sp.]|uniref:serpin family protein n=1 Tax=Arsukibacterium sp. TaxID=1977258 RepID=UPI002FDB4990